MEIAVLACGCFWGPEKKFGSLNGVYKTEVGYCGGKTEKTTYQEVCSGNTNHAEVVKINFDPKIISYEEILNFFFKIHDPTTLNRQGNDIGTHYRSIAFYTNLIEKDMIINYIKLYYIIELPLYFKISRILFVVGNSSSP